MHKTTCKLTKTRQRNGEILNSHTEQRCSLARLQGAHFLRVCFCGVLCCVVLFSFRDTVNSLGLVISHSNRRLCHLAFRVRSHTRCSSRRSRLTCGVAVRGVLAPHDGDVDWCASANRHSGLETRSQDVQEAIQSISTHIEAESRANTREQGQARRKNRGLGALTAHASPVSHSSHVALLCVASAHRSCLCSSFGVPSLAHRNWIVC